jgi:hypothetical protein
MALINAYRKDTGEKVRIPEHWIGHPKLGAPFRKTPLQRAADKKAAAPSPATTDTPAAGDAEKE